MSHATVSFEFWLIKIEMQQQSLVDWHLFGDQQSLIYVWINKIHGPRWRSNICVYMHHCHLKMFDTRITCRLCHNLCFIRTSIWILLRWSARIKWIRIECFHIYTIPKCERRRAWEEIECNPLTIRSIFKFGWIDFEMCFGFSNWIKTFTGDEWEQQHRNALFLMSIFFGYKMFVILGIFKLICSLVNVYLVCIWTDCLFNNGNSNSSTLFRFVFFLFLFSAAGHIDQHFHCRTSFKGAEKQRSWTLLAIPITIFNLTVRCFGQIKRRFRWYSSQDKKTQ